MASFGPFSTEKSFLVRMNSRADATALENFLKSLFSSFRFTMPKVTDQRNGETEWYLMDCYSELKMLVEDFAQRKGDIVRPMNLAWMLDSKENDQALINKLDELILRQAAKLGALKENAAAERRFVNFVNGAKRYLIGVAAIEKGGNIEYEIYLSPEYDNMEALDELLGANLRLEGEDHWASAHVCVGITTSKYYKRADISIPWVVDGKNIFEEEWESERFVKNYAEKLKWMAFNYPLPPAFEKYVGRTFIDDLSEKAKNEIARQLWALFNNASDVGEN